MALNPVGPLPASTYWRRRAVLALGLIVVLLVLKSCASGGRAAKVSVKTTALPKQTPTAGVRPSASASAVPTSARTSGPTPGPTSAPTSAPSTIASGPLCTDGQLTVTATTDAAAYALGASPRITLTVKNTSGTSCRRDLGPGAVELLVYSGTDRIWSGDDCNPSTATSIETLAAGGTRSVVRTWSGHRSKPECAGPQAAAKVGSYIAVAKLRTLSADSANFVLHP